MSDFYRNLADVLDVLDDNDVVVTRVEVPDRPWHDGGDRPKIEVAIPVFERGISAKAGVDS